MTLGTVLLTAVWFVWVPLCAWFVISCSVAGEQRCGLLGALPYDQNFWRLFSALSEVSLFRHVLAVFLLRDPYDLYPLELVSRLRALSRAETIGEKL